MVSDRILKDLRDQFTARIKGIPAYTFPEVSNISPQALTKSIAHCSQALEHTADLLAEMPILRYKITEIERLARPGDVDPMEMAAAKDFVLTHTKFLEGKEGKLKTHLSTLRSLLSAVTRHPNLLCGEIDGEDNQTEG